MGISLFLDTGIGILPSRELIGNTSQKTNHLLNYNNFLSRSSLDLKMLLDRVHLNLRLCMIKEYYKHNICINNHLYAYAITPEYSQQQFYNFTIFDSQKLLFRPHIYQKQYQFQSIFGNTRHFLNNFRQSILISFIFL